MYLWRGWLHLKGDEAHLYTHNIKFLPNCPAGCVWAYSFELKPFLNIKAEAIASPIEEATAKLAVGTIPKLSASSLVEASKQTSTLFANIPSLLPINPTIFAFLLLKTGSRKINSGVDPLFDKKITVSPSDEFPRSPCTASDGCKNAAGVPVLLNVAAIFFPTWPDFPIPVTTTLWACTH